jgi:hypothetical protein
MARKTEETTIRGRTFKVTQLNGMSGTKFYYRMAGALIPALSKMGTAVRLMDKFGDADVSELADMLPSIGDAANVLFEKLPPEEFERTVKELLSSTTVKPLDGSPEQALMPIFDDELAGEVGTVLQLVAFALKVNFGNFLPALAAQAANLAKVKAGRASKESTTSPGPAGGSSSSASQP